MTTATPMTWHEANQRYLNATVARVRRLLLHHTGMGSDPDTLSAEDGDPLETELRQTVANLSRPPALDRVVRLFNLTPFERDVLLLCAGMEMDAGFPALCGDAQSNSQRCFPTFGLAMAALNSPSWDAISPNRPLRRWQLIDVGTGPTLTLSPLRIDERVLHFLTGVPGLDERLSLFIKISTASAELVDSHQELVDRLLATWSRMGDQSSLPVLQLCGEESPDKETIASTLCRRAGFDLYVLPAQLLPTQTADLQRLVRLWERESLLSRAVLLLDCDQVDLAERVASTGVSYIIQEMSSPLLLSCKERWRAPGHLGGHRSLISFEVKPPTTSEQRQIWTQALGPLAPNFTQQVEMLIGQFNISATRIRSVCDESLSHWAIRLEQSKERQRSGQADEGEELTSDQLGHTLWETCRQQSRRSMEDLAQRIDPAAGWDDLVLPEPQKQVLADISAHVRQRAKVYETWGFKGKSSRGMGISALFAGASGTGKTMAAEVIARELQLDLYRIDLSTVVSKYIGETEKNLSRVFTAAEAGGSILLFDEADSLFGKRSDVKDSHDRYANMEVSYLLQRMEAYQGLSILTTNLKDAIDVAFMRRIRFAVRFPFPDVRQRTEIWRRVFPKQTPTEGLKFNRLAQLQVAGGNIRNIALNAAFLAADAGQAVRMEHVLQAARNEYAKLERTLTENEIKGWL